jgi:hypothetical protein
MKTILACLGPDPIRIRNNEFSSTYQYTTNEVVPRKVYKHVLITSLDMVEMGRSRAAPTDTAREKEQHHTDI